MNKQPNWTVCYNIVSPESDRWVGTGWEFFDQECDAEKSYKRHISLGNVPCKRPYFPPSDYKHLGIAHEEARLLGKKMADIQK